MSTEQKDLDQNAFALRMNRFWNKFKQGKVIDYRLMGLLLILAVSIIAIAYIVIERNKAVSTSWMRFEEANSQSAFDEISKNSQNTVEGRLARLEIARNQLGVAGIDQLAVMFPPEARKKAIENIETAREDLGKLLEEFKNDPVFKVQCLLGLAKAEAALVAVPTKEGQLTEFKGQVSRVVELLDQVVQAAPDTPWATDSKKLADALRDPNSATRHAFVRVQQTLFSQGFGENAPPSMGQLPGGLDGFPKGRDPFVPGVPSDPGKAPKGPGPIPPEAPPKTTPTRVPGGPIAPTPPGTTTPGTSTPGQEPVIPIAPAPKVADPKTPMPPNNTPTPAISDPKAPTPPVPTPAIPDPKAPIPPTPPPAKTPDPKTPTPEKK